MAYCHLPHGVPVLEAAARHLLDGAGADPAALSRALVLLPTRRAARALGAAFLRVAGGRPLLLPRLVAIGDIDENPLFAHLAAGLPQAVPKLVREAALAGLIRRHDAAVLPDRALRLAIELAALLDEADEAEIDLSDLSALAPQDFARHWQRTLGFLELATLRWREVLARRGQLDPVARRMRMLRALAARLAAVPPADAVLAVGIATPAPAIAALLGAIAGLKRGTVLLAGLDATLPEAAWQAIGPGHPQAEMKALLARLGLARGEIPVFPHAAPPHALRARLLARALLPATALDWNSPPPAGEVAGLTLLDAPDSASEARAIALAVREALDQPEARIAVITPDRALAERVCTALARFGVRVEDSAAMPLGRTPPGALLRLLAGAVARGLAPVPLLSLIRHPLVAGGMPPEVFRAAGRNFELHALRGPRPASRLVLTEAVLAERVRRRDAEEAPPAWLAGVRALQRALAAALAPLQVLCARPEVAPAELLRATVAAAETLAATDARAGPDRLWSGPEGAALSRHVAAAALALEEMAPIAPRWWPDLLDQLLAQASVRARRMLGAEDAAHPRVEILGVLEARLLDHDVRILAGLNEGTWPAAPDPGPWLSRPQRAGLGLADPDAQVGNAAFDFAAAACAAPRVILSRAGRVEGEPGVASRWLTRLAALCGEAALAPTTDHAGLAQLLDRGIDPRDEPRPCPRPALAVRPRALPVTAVDTLRRNPYAIYAQRILRLRPLEPLDQEADAADWGELVHGVAADFFAGLAAEPAADAEAAFLRHAEQRRSAFAARPGLVALWKPRLSTLAPWFAATFAGRDGVGFRPEVTGQRQFALESGSFVLTARADLVEIAPDGSLALIDFKTGSAPSGAEVRGGRALQLPLSALIAAQGGFTGGSPAPVARLTYARLPGGAEPGTLATVAEGEAVAAAMAEAEAVLAGLVARYADPAQGYRAASVDGDYAHLARRGAWGEAPDAEETP